MLNYEFPLKNKKHPQAYSYKVLNPTLEQLLISFWISENIVHHKQTFHIPDGKKKFEDISK